MEANQSSRVLAVGTGLTSKARRIGSVANRQRVFGQYLFSVQIRHRDFCGGD